MTAPEVVPCGHCGRPLTDPDSRALGYGPVCAAGVLGLDTHRTPVPRPRRRKNVDQIPLPLEEPVDSFDERTAKAHAESVARGEHDDRCEYLAVPGSYLCHCSKRRREAAGHTKPPEDLIFQQPICPRCDEEVHHDGDSWNCPRCCCHWRPDGTSAQFYDDYGDLDADLAKWRERAEERAPTTT